VLLFTGRYPAALYRFILGIHQLGDEDLRKEPREVIKLEREDS